MKSRDQILLEQAYDEVNEGIWDRIKGQAAGGMGAAKALFTPGKTMGQGYAQAQQKSIFNSFVKKVQSEIKEFEDDIQKLGKADLNALKSSHPEIDKIINSYKTLLANLAKHQATVKAVS